MQWARERGDCCCDSAVHVCEGARYDARGEGRGVQLVVRLKYQPDVEDVRLLLSGHLALEHVEEVGGDVQILLRRYRLLAFAQSPYRGDDCRELPDQSRSGPHSGLARNVSCVLIVEGERRNACAERVHRLGVARKLTHQREKLWLKLVVGCYVAF